MEDFPGETFPGPLDNFPPEKVKCVEADHHSEWIEYTGDEDLAEEHAEFLGQLQRDLGGGRIVSSGLAVLRRALGLSGRRAHSLPWCSVRGRAVSRGRVLTSRWKSGGRAVSRGRALSSKWRPRGKGRTRTFEVEENESENSLRDEDKEMLSSSAVHPRRNGPDVGDSSS